ncbi:MAG: ATP-binding cassette domain-containing protein, partial [Reinekea forsetii]|nr:ATP-binding cassette domain-containing protein [Reinekea forsetii]
MTAQTAATAQLAIELRGIDKRFGAVHANKYIDLQVEKGTIHGIVGENGAGKSTLMSIIYGFYEADEGQIYIDGQQTRISDSKAAIGAGIGMVHQHFMLIQNFTALENVILGAEGSMLLNVSMAKARAELERLAREYGLDVPLDIPVERLSVGLQQRIEILKALYRGARIL